MTAATTNPTQATVRRQFGALRALLSAFTAIPQETRAHFAEVKNGHAQRSQFSALPDEAVSDLGMSAEDILSARSYNKALPFFMRSGYGKRG